MEWDFAEFDREEIIHDKSLIIYYGNHRIKTGTKCWAVWPPLKINGEHKLTGWLIEKPVEKSVESSIVRQPDIQIGDYASAIQQWAQRVSKWGNYLDLQKRLEMFVLLTAYFGVQRGRIRFSPATTDEDYYRFYEIVLPLHLRQFCLNFTTY